MILFFAISPRKRNEIPTKIKFATKLRGLVSQREQDQTTTHAIPQLCRLYDIKRRRFYDVINVFLAIGCATRTEAEEFRLEEI
jgi:hypothetical protein